MDAEVCENNLLNYRVVVDLNFGISRKSEQGESGLSQGLETMSHLMSSHLTREFLQYKMNLTVGPIDAVVRAFQELQEAAWVLQAQKPQEVR